MEAEAQNSSPSEESRAQLILFAAAGAGIYAILKTLDPLIAFPLRQISSSLATVFLNALSIPSTLSGTVISTSQFTFDVNPDCSGSTSLRIMLTLGALWFGMYPNLTLGRRLLCLALAAPIAVFFNAVRVTILVLLGNARGEPIEGFPHELVGILSFGFGMAVVYLMTLVMAKEPTVRKRSGPRLHLAFLVFALLVCYAPVLWGAWSLTPTTSGAVGHLALIVVGLALIILAVWGESGRVGQVRRWIPPVLFGLSLVLLPIGTMTDVITLATLSLLGTLFAVILYLRGWEVTLRTLPLFGVLLLGLPGVHFPLLRSLMAGLAPKSSYQLTTLAEMVLAALLVGLYLSLASRGDRSESARSRTPVPLLPKLTAVPMKLFILGGFIGTLFQTYFNSQAASFDLVHRLEVPIVLGEWKGVDLEPTAEEIEVMGRDRLVSRDYSRPGGDTIRFLASATGADRSRAHPPEQCMIVAGWEVQEEKILGASGDLPMTRILLAKEDARLEMRYWVKDPEGKVFGNFRELRSLDVTRRLTGKRTDWHVYRVFGPPGSPAIEDFIATLNAPPVEKGPTPTGTP